MELTHEELMKRIRHNIELASKYFFGEIETEPLVGEEREEMEELINEIFRVE